MKKDIAVDRRNKEHSLTAKDRNFYIRYDYSVLHALLVI